MSEDTQVPNDTAQGASDKELNFRKQEAMYEKLLEKERQEKQQLQQMLQQRSQPDDDTSDEPYIDEKRLAKKLDKFGQQSKQETESIVQREVRKALEEERKVNWLRSNPDFNEIMSHAQKFADRDPELAETILNMPEGFERQKLVYRNIKALGLHKKEEPKPTIQETIDKNRRSPYYQPSGQGAPAYAGISDFSQAGQKSAYEKMKQLQQQARL